MDPKLLAEQVISHPWFPRRSAEYYRWYPKSLHPIEATALDTLSTSQIEGIYLHIPFCDEICSFCPFNKQITSTELVDQYVDAIIREIRLLKDRESAAGLSFIYFGGGTPSILSAAQVEKIVDTAAGTCRFAERIEITMEAHPRNCVDDYLAALRNIGVNRISSGIQSFSDDILRAISATHNAKISTAAITAMPKHFDNWGVDLLYRCPGQTVRSWEADLETLLMIAPPEHISCYTLFLQDDRKQPTVQTDVYMAVAAQSLLEVAGYSHYASCATGGFDYARLGRECVYEARHWGAPQASYAAIGSGAIGFLGGMTTVNYHDTRAYVHRALNGDPTVSLSSTENVKELKHRYFVLGVKTLSVDLARYSDSFGTSAVDDFANEIHRLEAEGLAQLHEKSLSLTNLGRYYVDQISEVFWSVSETEVPHPETNSLRLVEQLSRQ